MKKLQDELLLNKVGSLGDGRREVGPGSLRLELALGKRRGQTLDTFPRPAYALKFTSLNLSPTLSKQCPCP